MRFLKINSLLQIILYSSVLSLDFKSDSHNMERQREESFYTSVTHLVIRQTAENITALLSLLHLAFLHRCPFSFEPPPMFFFHLFQQAEGGERPQGRRDKRHPSPRDGREGQESLRAEREHAKRIERNGYPERRRGERRGRE